MSWWSCISSMASWWKSYFFFLSEILSSGCFLFQAFKSKSLFNLQFSSDLNNISSLEHQEANSRLVKNTLNGSFSFKNFL